MYFLSLIPWKKSSSSYFSEEKKMDGVRKGAREKEREESLQFLKVNRIEAIFEFSKAFAVQWNLAKMNYIFYMDNCCLCFKYAANWPTQGSVHILTTKLLCITQVGVLYFSPPLSPQWINCLISEQIQLHFFLQSANSPDLYLCDRMQNMILSFFEVESPMAKEAGRRRIHDSRSRLYCQSNHDCEQFTVCLYCPIRQTAELS